MRRPTRPGWPTSPRRCPHNRLGEVDPDAYRTLLRALDSGKPADFDKVLLAGTTKLANPQATFAFELEGADSWAWRSRRHRGLPPRSSPAR
jgi:hypothetical protein